MGFEAQYDVQMHDHTPVIRITGDLDHYNVPSFRSVVSDVIDQGYRNIVVDMSGVDFMDSGGMSGIIFAAKRLMTIQGHLALAGCNPRIARKLDIGGLSKVPELLTTHDSVEDAIEQSSKH